MLLPDRSSLQTSHGRICQVLIDIGRFPYGGSAALESARGGPMVQFSFRTLSLKLSSLGPEDACFPAQDEWLLYHLVVCKSASLIVIALSARMSRDAFGARYIVCVSVEIKQIRAAELLLACNSGSLPPVAVAMEIVLVAVVVAVAVAMSVAVAMAVAVTVYEEESQT